MKLWIEGRPMMNWKQDFNALIERTMTFAKQVEQRPSIPDFPIALTIAEQALAETSKPIASHPTITPTSLPMSERYEIQQPVSNFKPHPPKRPRSRHTRY